MLRSLFTKLSRESLVKFKQLYPSQPSERDQSLLCSYQTLILSEYMLREHLSILSTSATRHSMSMAKKLICKMKKWTISIKISFSRTSPQRDTEVLPSLTRTFHSMTSMKWKPTQTTSRVNKIENHLNKTWSLLVSLHCKMIWEIKYWDQFNMLKKEISL